jgi:hypothetical protein
MKWPGLLLRSDRRRASLARSPVDAVRPGPSGGGAADYVPAAFLLGAGLLGLGAAWALTGGASGQYLVLARPGSTLSETVNLVRSAGGDIAARGLFANIVIADSSRPGFPVSMRDAGAWLAVPVPALAGCAEPSSRENIF